VRLLQTDAPTTIAMNAHFRPARFAYSTSSRYGARVLALVVASLLAGATTVFAADPLGARYLVSPDGREILDSQQKLAWRRCVEGMYWNGRTCEGTPLTLDHAQAMARAKEMANADQKAWRVPQMAQLRRLAESRRSDAAAFALLFPAAPNEWHWSASVTVDSTAVNPYNYGNVMRGLNESGVNRISFMHGWALNMETGQARSDVLKRELLWVRLVHPYIP
jgi:Protein of unknown function (DUF1566)